ncbi:MAG TPA: tetratricopeptide repeat protein [Roseiflexaceae bacterium]|nr:tetratricopeptide repeat protein [Roseiflexaceae bacterium]
MLTHTLKIGRLAGVELRIHWSLALLVLLAVWLLWPVVGPAWALLGALLAPGSVAAHELGHVLAAHGRGIGAREVVLWGAGGITRLEAEPEQPADVLLISGAGPLTSMLLGAACGLAAGLVGAGPLRTVLEAAQLFNLLVALDNLLPVGSLDGAKMLQAALRLAPWPSADRIALAVALAVALGLAVYTASQGRWLALAVALAALVAASLIDPLLRYFAGMALTALLRPGDYQLFYRQDFEQALAHYDRALARSPRDPELYQRRAQARLEQGDRAGALADLDRAVEHAPGMWLPLRERAALCLRLGAFGRARADYTRALALRPDDPLCYEGRIYAAVQQRDYPAALADYAELIRLEPGRAETYAARAYVRHRAGDAAGAEVDLAEALARAPEAAPAHTARGLILLERGDHAGARDAFERAVALAPHDPAALNNRGFLARIEGRDAEALADFERAIALAPGLHYPYVSRGEQRARQGDHTGALADVDRALELMPDYAEALLQRAALRHAQGDAPAARADAERALALDPQLLRLPEGLVEPTLAGQLPWALLLAGWAEARLPGSPLPDLWRGDALRANGEPEAALAAYTRALALAPDDTDLLARREQVRQNHRGDAEDAEDTAR